MKKIQLKKRKKSRRKMFLIVVVLILFSLTTVLLRLNHVGDFILDVSEVEVKKITKRVLNESINKILLDYSEVNNLFVVEKDERGSIKAIDIDSSKSNRMLLLVNESINTYMRELENGKSSLIDIKNSLTTNKKIFSTKPGVILEIPMGVVTGNSLLSNLGPKVPIRVFLNGELKSQLRTKIENYGINNVLVKLMINVEISEQIVMPLVTREIVFDTDIIIAMKMIQGDVPDYYIGGIEQNKSSDMN